jgi:polyisoprenoid-binding protein YceI
MKTKFFLHTLILTAVAGALISFATPAPSKYKVDTKASSLGWTGKKVTGQHNGNVQLQSGELITDGKLLKQATFEIDLSSITVTDIKDPESNGKLVGHLKSEDFFNASQFPKASFTLTSATPTSGDEYEVKGKLTIKGITNEVVFPATIKNDGKKSQRARKLLLTAPNMISVSVPPVSLRTWATRRSTMILNWT